MTRTPYNFLV